MFLFSSPASAHIPRVCVCRQAAARDSGDAALRSEELLCHHSPPPTLGGNRCWADVSGMWFNFFFVCDAWQVEDLRSPLLSTIIICSHILFLAILSHFFFLFLQDGYAQLSLLPTEGMKGVVRVKFVNEQVSTTELPTLLALSLCTVISQGIWSRACFSIISRIFPFGTSSIAIFSATPLNENSRSLHFPSQPPPTQSTLSFSLCKTFFTDSISSYSYPEASYLHACLFQFLILLPLQDFFFTYPFQVTLILLSFFFFAFV